MSNQFKELEYKYNADKVGLAEFTALMNKIGQKMYPIEKVIEVSSWDIYYTNPKKEFIRFRMSENKPELTIKRKTNELNNNDRIEVNVPVAPTLNEPTVDAFTNLLGYDKNFKIYKSCFIYFFPEVDIVYYIVYDENLREQGRYIEIEVLEKYAEHPGNPAEVCFARLKTYENFLSEIGITPQNRLKKSLFEMYSK